MQNYLITIIEESAATMFRVTATSLREAKIKALAHLNKVDEADIDLDTTGDMTIVGMTEDKVEDYADDTYVDFGDVSRQKLGEQCQYGSRYIDGYIPGWPNLGDGLRFTGYDSNGRINNYHDMKIHHDDVAEFVRRVKLYQEHNIVQSVAIDDSLG